MTDVFVILLPVPLLLCGCVVAFYLEWSRHRAEMEHALRLGTICTQIEVQLDSHKPKTEHTIKAIPTTPLLRCVMCHGDFEPECAKAVCSKCAAGYHIDCYREAGSKCRVRGCGGVAREVATK